MKKLVICIIIGIMFISCDLGCNNTNTSKNEVKKDPKTSEQDIVQENIYNYFERTGENTIPERSKLKVIGPWDENVPFKGDLSIKLPTKLKYTWNTKGEITEYTSKN